MEEKGGLSTYYVVLIHSRAPWSCCCSLPGDGLDMKSKFITSGIPRAMSCSITPARLHLWCERTQRRTGVLTHWTQSYRTHPELRHPSEWKESPSSTSGSPGPSWEWGCQIPARCRDGSRSLSPLCRPGRPAARPGPWRLAAPPAPPVHCLRHTQATREKHSIPLCFRQKKIKSIKGNIGGRNHEGNFWSLYYQFN